MPFPHDHDGVWANAILELAGRCCLLSLDHETASGDESELVRTARTSLSC